MPAVRLTRRRRSSLALSALNSAKAGYYGLPSPSPRPVTFAPNVTPGTYVEPEIIPSTPSTPCPDSPTSKLFPPSELPAPAPTRRRVPPGKRRSMGYIPRPPNAFMLFRADFVRQKHVPGSIETNHGSLSKIIGNCWRSLPLEEKHVWEVKAKHAKAEHKLRYPEYRFRPVHTKNKDKKKDKPFVTAEDERRCEEVAQLLLEGKKGDELAAAVRDLDRMRSDSPAPFEYRRSSSVPLPNDWNPIAIPTAPFLPGGRRESRPERRPSLMDRILYGQRRSSSARPATNRSWTMPAPLQRDDSSLPDVDTSLFDPAFLDATAGFAFPPAQPDHAFNFNDFRTSLPPHANTTHDLAVSPLDNIDPFSFNPVSSSSVPFDPTPTTALPELDPMTWLPVDRGHSHPSSTYSGSPTPSDHSLPVHAPQPQAPATGNYDLWKDLHNAYPQIQQHQQQQQHHQQQQHMFNGDTDMGSLGLNFSQSACGTDPNTAEHLRNYAVGLESLFDSSYAMANPGTHEMDFGFSNNEILNEY